MKRFFIPGLLLALAVACTSPAQEEENKLPLRVGNIAHDPALDTAAFELCHEDITLTYYNFSGGILYKGEKAAIIARYAETYQAPAGSDESGYVTIRFAVNCEGKAGRFRVTEMNHDYNEKAFSSEITDQLLSIAVGLDGWLPGELDGKVFDYNQYLTFKITDGRIERIMP